MKVIKHGNCLRFECRECGCVFQATEKENGTEYRAYHNGDDSGFYRTCPDCGCEDVKGEAVWKNANADDGNVQKHVEAIEHNDKYRGWVKSDKSCPICHDMLIYNPMVILTSLPEQREFICPSCGHTEYEVIGNVSPCIVNLTNEANADVNK